MTTPSLLSRNRVLSARWAAAGLAFLFLFLFLAISRAEAASRYWVGAVGNSSWNSTANWSTVERGTGGASVPNRSDVAIFSYSGTTVNLNHATGADIAGLILKPNWTGSIVFGTGGNALTVGQTGIMIGSGRLLMGTGALNCSGSFIQTGGVVIVSSTNFTLSGDLIVRSQNATGRAASFTSTGTIIFEDLASDQTFAVAPSATTSFSGITLNLTGAGTIDDLILSGSNLTVLGGLTITQGNLDLATNSKTITASGGLIVASNAQSTITTNSNVTISGSVSIGDNAVITATSGTWTFQDDSNQSVDLDGQQLENIVINSRGGSGRMSVIIAGGPLANSGTLTITRGRLDLDGNHLQSKGNLTLANDANAILDTWQNISTSGSVSVGDAAFLVITGGTLTMSGTSAATLDLDSESIRNLTINKITGGNTAVTVTANGTSLNLSGALTITFGNLNLQANDIPLTVSGGITLANSAQAEMQTDANVTVSGAISVGASAILNASGGGVWTIRDNSTRVNFDNNILYGLRVSTRASGSGTQLTGTASVSTSLTIDSGSILSLSGYTLFATGATVSNSGRIDQDGRNKTTYSSFVAQRSSSLISSKQNASETNSYGVSENIVIRLTESSKNLYGLTAETLTGTFVAGTDTETGALVETNLNSGIFVATIPTANRSVTARNGTLETTATRTVYFTYWDLLDRLQATGSTTIVVGGGSDSDWRTQRANEMRTAWEAQQAAASAGGGGGGGGGGTTSTPTRTTTEEEEEVTTPVEIGEEAVETESSLSLSLEQQDGRALKVTIDGKEVAMRDVPSSAWYAPFVFSLIEKNVVSGYRDTRGTPTGEFGPANSVTFAEVAKMALGAAGFNPLSGQAPGLRSARGQWSAGYIAKMEELGVSVFEDERLNVNEPAPRGAVLQIIMEVFGKEAGEASGDKYSDVSTGTKYSGAIETATADGIVSGDDNSSTFRPRSPINRAEVSKVILNSMQIYR